eukprot:Ihof_evm3s216 gene=Ihof_evmTU3s216
MSLTGKLIEVNNDIELKEILDIHIGGLVVVHFYADWAPQCQHMNEVLTEIAAQHPFVVCVKLAAEEAGDLLDQYEVSAVPCFIFFKNQQMVDRLDGANAPLLTSKVNKYAEGITVSIPTRKPKEDLNTRIKKILNQSPCVLFMKGTAEGPKCGFSRQIIELLKEKNADFTTFDILEDEAVRQGLKALSNWPTYPQLYINGELIGGLDIVREMAQSGDLEEILPIKKDLNSRLEALIKKALVMLFMKGDRDEPKCGFSRQVIDLLNEVGIEYTTFDILTDNEVRQGLKAYSNWPTYPQLYVNGELLGGLDIIR